MLCFNIKEPNKGNNAIFNKNLYKLLTFYIIAMLHLHILKASLSEYVICYVLFHDRKYFNIMVCRDKTIYLVTGFYHICSRG